MGVRPKFINIVVCGVGGQGIITLSRIIAESAIKDGVNAIVSETHGLSQRGGSVEVHVRIGEAYSPLISKGEADLLLSTEMIETARNISYIKEGGVVITSDTMVRPPIPGVRLPKKEDIIREIEKNKIEYYLIPSRAIAERLGSYLVENMVLLGALYKVGGLDRFISIESLKESLSSLRNPETNIKAFEEGYGYASKKL
ncbi:MAG: indolepyruvate oxidoreductase subunit beta [Caldisphaeraceae archaeon]|nr:indolepyruvate oxidoreductase subunit beta [Caldisphaeraceae archaeon]